MNENTVFVEHLALELGQALLAREFKLVTAESCTGGLVAEIITRIPGSSNWFEQGFIPYSNAAKQSMLGVSAASLQAFGAVSEEVAREMVEGALLHSQGNCALAITGIAGPGGGSAEKPVGMVWFAWGCRESRDEKKITVGTECQQFLGDRAAIRLQAAQFGLQRMLELVRPPH